MPEDQSATLRRIASALGLPVSDLFEAPAGPASAPDADQIRQATAAIMRIMASLPGPHERTRCLGQVMRALAEPRGTGDG